jgi:hypothetical protein
LVVPMAADEPAGLIVIDCSFTGAAMVTSNVLVTPP